MNTRRREPDPLRADETAREWALQERAMREVRAGASVDDGLDARCIDGEAIDGAGLAAYRRIARALRTPPAGHLPSNFAFHVAQLAARLPPVSRLDLRLEQWLVRGLVLAMAVGAAGATLYYGTAWLRGLEAFGAQAPAWFGLLAGCVALSWLPEGARRWLSRTPH